MNKDMWESLERVFTSDNAPLVIILAVLIMLYIGYLLRSGHLHFSNDVLRVGGSERERAVIRHQIEYTHGFVMAIEAALDKSPDYNEYRAKWIFELVFDEIVKWIVFNHIETTNTYIELKQDAVLHICKSNSPSRVVKSPEFETMIKGKVSELIRQLVKIRKEYS